MDSHTLCQADGHSVSKINRATQPYSNGNITQERPVDFSNIHSIQAAGCNKIYYYNRFYHKKPLSKNPSSSSRWDKKRQRAKKYPSIKSAACGLHPYWPRLPDHRGFTASTSSVSVACLLAIQLLKSARRGVGIVSAAGLSVS